MGDHYLPQMLLKHFCDGDGLLWVARKGQDQPFRTTPRNVFAGKRPVHQAHPRRQSRPSWDGPFDGTDRQRMFWLGLRAPLPTRFVRSSRVPGINDFPTSGQTQQDALKRFFFAIARRTPESQKRVRTPEDEARRELYVQLSRDAESQGSDAAQ